MENKRPERQKKNPNGTYKGMPAINPHGRPPLQTSFNETTRNFLEEIDPKDKDRRTRNEVMIANAYERAKRTDKACHSLWRRAYGKEVETLEIKKQYKIIPAPEPKAIEAEPVKVATYEVKPDEVKPDAGN